MAKSDRYTTPPGIAVYPRLKTPDTKFSTDGLGTYKADISIPASEAKKFLDPILEAYKKHTGKAHPKNPDSSNRNALFYVETDGDGEETGNWVIKARVKNKNTRSGEVWDRKPQQFDAKGHPINVNPYGGTKMRVSLERYDWEHSGSKGVSLQPLAVKILDLVEGSGRSAGDYGFDEEEDGYTEDSAADAFEDDDEDTASADEDDIDF